MKTVEFKSVSKRYGSRFGVHDFSLEIVKGQRMVILGPSGCGKSTVLRLLSGLIAPDSGTICINGGLVSHTGRIIVQPEERNLGMVFQDLALWPHLSVKGNLEFGLRAQGLSKRERNERVSEIIKLVRMETHLQSRPHQLSGGEQQRIALARALVLYPKILLMDEPLSSLDFELNRIVRREIIRIQDTLGLTLLYVTHNLEEAFEMATDVVVMKNGSVDFAGTPKEIRAYFT